MYRVGLVQNQSEMAHYGYSDARPILSDLGYEAILYTADNIEELHHALSRKSFDAVIFASNALNDKTIRAEAFSESFISIFSEWLKEGRGFISFIQLRLAQLGLNNLHDSNLKFLPTPLNQVRATVRPPTEKAAAGTLLIPTGTEKHITLLYPNSIDEKAVQRHALSFKSLPGLYWHYWDNANFADWDALIIDPESSPAPRGLVLSAKESLPYRIVLSALTLDWHNQRLLLENLLRYVVEGRHNTAVLADEGSTSTAFNYLLGTLQSRKFPFQKYFVGQNLQRLEERLVNGVHTTLLLGPFTERRGLPPTLNTEIDSRVASGQLKLLAIESVEQGIRKFSVVGRERYVFRLLNEIELKIQSELKNGYVDGSFWSTAETLQTLTTLPQQIVNYTKLVDKVLQLANDHDREGSYDEVFGATCAFLWLRGNYLGVSSSEAQATAAWIRNKVSKYDDREKALAYTTFASLQILSPDEKENLRRILSRLVINQLSEIDLIVYMRAALSIDDFEVVPSLIRALKERQKDNGAWLDFATTATAATTLLDALNDLKTEYASYGQFKSGIEEMIFLAIIHIQDALERSLAAVKEDQYLWDGKASTTVKCLQAWLKFDELLDLPVYEVVEILSRYDTVATQIASGRNALSVLEELKEENQSLQEDNSRLNTQLRGTATDVKRLWWFNLALRILVAAIILLLYVMVSLAIGVSRGLGKEGFSNLLYEVFGASWGFHLTFLGVVAAIAATPWTTWLLPKKYER